MKLTYIHLFLIGIAMLFTIITTEFLIRTYILDIPQVQSIPVVQETSCTGNTQNVSFVIASSESYYPAVWLDTLNNIGIDYNYRYNPDSLFRVIHQFSDTTIIWE